MPEETGPNFKILLLGLPPDVAEIMGSFASRWGLILYVPRQIPNIETLNLIKDAAPDLAFVWTGGPQGTSLLETVRTSNPSVRAVAVSRSFKVSEVLDALDSGAIDYCALPFDDTHLKTLLDTCLQDHLLLAISLEGMSFVPGG